MWGEDRWESYIILIFNEKKIDWYLSAPILIEFGKLYLIFLHLNSFVGFGQTCKLMVVAELVGEEELWAG